MDNVGHQRSLGVAVYWLTSACFIATLTYIALKWKRKTGEGSKNEQVSGIGEVPGPPGLPLIGNFPQLWPLSRMIDVVTEWTKKYGPVFKLSGCGITIVLLNDGPSAQALLRSPLLEHANKMAKGYDLMKPYITNGVLVSKGKFWQAQRKIILKALTFQSIRGYLPMLNNHCARLVASFEKVFADGEGHDINELINCSFVDITCEMITGLGVEDDEELKEYHHNFETWKDSIAYRFLYPWNILDFVWRLNPLSRHHFKAVNGMVNFAKNRLEQYKTKRVQEMLKDDGIGSPGGTPNDGGVSKEGGKIKNVLNELLSAGVPDNQIVDEICTLLFGGHDTGATAIRFFCFAMALHQKIQTLCRNEVDLVFQDPVQVNDGHMTYESLTALKYLERCILESLRLFPPVMVIFRKLDSPLTIEMEGKPVKLPGNTNVCVSPFLVQRDGAVFPDPMRFDPDRFLPEEIAQRHSYAYLPFSSGMRNCLAQKFAMIELKMICAYLLRNFEILPGEDLEEIRVLPNITLTPERDYKLIFKRRNL